MPTPQEQAEYEQYLKETGQSAPESSDAKRTHIMSDINNQIDHTDYGAAMGNALGGGATGAGLSKLTPKLAGILGQALEGGAMGAAQTPGDWQDKLRGFLTGGAVQGGVAGVGKLLGKAGDVGMQVAVGRKKYTPGVGTELADQGLVGTRGMMKDQTANRLGAVGQQMQDIASTVPSIDSSSIGRDIADKAAAPYTGKGTIAPSARDLPAIADIKQFADDVASRGEETGAQALSRRKAAGSSAYSAKSGEPKQNVAAQLSKMEQQKYSQALKDADPTGGMAKADASYAALKKGQKALDEEPSLSGMGMISRPVQALGGALPASVLSQGATKGGKLAEFLAPLSRQAAVGGQSQDPERAEYEQYLKETGQSR